MASLGHNVLTLCGLVMPYDDIDLGQHWFRQWLVAWWHQAITWASVDLSSVKSCGIYLRTISHKMLNICILDTSLKITNLRSQLHLPGANQLTEFQYGPAQISLTRRCIHCFLFFFFLSFFSNLCIYCWNLTVISSFGLRHFLFFVTFIY